MASTETARLPLTYINRNLPNTGGWQDRHLAAIARPEGVERGIVKLLTGWLEYADCHERINESRIGDDYYAGPYWASMGAEMIKLLSMSLGRLDGGTLDTIIGNTLAAEGFNRDEL